MVACGVPEHSAWGGHLSDRTTLFFPSVSWITRKGRVGGPACGTHHAVQVLVVIRADGLAVQQHAAALQRVEVLQDVHTGALSAARGPHQSRYLAWGQAEGDILHGHKMFPSQRQEDILLPGPCGAAGL